MNSDALHHRCRKFTSAWNPLIVIGVLLSILSIEVPGARAKRIFFAGYDGGFYIKSEELGGMKLRLGGALQSDYRYYGESERDDNRFDIRRARMAFKGDLTQYFSFGVEYEFQGNQSKHLVDAWGQANLFGTHALRFGQFKEPFSLEWQTRDKALYFAERSIMFSLGPGRDVGLMLHGSLFQDALIYGAGIFNGDGVDGSTGGNRHDDPEFASRVVVSPFRPFDIPWLKTVQFGASATAAGIDLSDVDLEVKSTGMFGTDLNLYELNANSKFGVLQDVDKRYRYALEAAWTHGPFAILGEYTHLTYTDLQPAGMPAQDADFSAWYAAALWSVTGEPIIIRKGKLKPMYPERFFNPAEGTYGAVVLAARVEHFSGDEDWIKPDASVSAEDADAASLAINWILFPMQRFILDFTYTDFSDPLKVSVDPKDGSVDFVDKETVVTFRFSLDF